MKTPEDYARMQKSFYSDSNTSAEEIVGNYDWHENFPYETNLLFRYADIRLPIFSDTASLNALDVCCGPGRMVARMRKHFKAVDGVDIAPRLLQVAQEKNPKSKFFESSGSDLGNAPSDSYDFVYSTIALQHIAVHSVRKQIFSHIRRVLKVGGKFTLQLAYLDSWPYLIHRRDRLLSLLSIARARRITAHAEWLEDRTDATTTNGLCDVALGPESIDVAKAEFEQLFGSTIEHWFQDVRILSNWRGARHEGYWASHWVFFHGTKAAI